MDEQRFEAAGYRVRLFLSIDLCGSTAFKSSKAGEAREAGAAPNWVTIFQNFYSDFPDIFEDEFRQLRNPSIGDDGCPEVWKAVGDELIFCGRVNNRKSCAVAISAFIKALYRYRKRLTEQKIDLNVKGSGWLAAFPEPNRTVQLRAKDQTPELLPASEALEAAADKMPFKFDFLGKAIDTGFRIASQAQPDKFVLSVQLACLLLHRSAELNFGYRIKLDPPTILKGVNKNHPYPLLYIETLEHLPTERLRGLENDLYNENKTPEHHKILEYLEAYSDVVGTDKIILKESHNSNNIDPPKSYLSHKTQISEHLAGERKTELDKEGIIDEHTSDEDIIFEGNALEPLGVDGESA